VRKFHGTFIKSSQPPFFISFVNPSESTPSNPLLGRRNAMKLLFGGAAGSFANGFWIEPGRLSVTRAEISCPRLPSALDGLRIGVMADIHFKPDQDEALLEQAVATLNREKPDLIALPGDFMDEDPAVIGPMLDLLKKLAPAHGVFASMGNHDGWAFDGSAMRRRFERAGISFLINRNHGIRVRNEKLAIAATDHVWLGKPDPAATLRGIAANTPVIALVHEPDYFDELTQRRDIQLQLSGHTHGGQCRVPFVDYTPAKVAYGRKYIHGAFESGDSRLFVTRGVGTVGLRVRFACPPEVAVLTLRAG
jgi:predicted MPP superfamily phosphohydrolase